MYRAIVVTVGVLVVFGIVVIVTLITRKRQNINNVDPYLEEFEIYQEDMIKNGYEISYDSEPTNLHKKEDLIYQLRAKVSNIYFEKEDPETKADPCTLWVTDKRLIIERRGKIKENSSFDFAHIKEFEFELEKNNYVFLFEYKSNIFKFETKDIYAIALIEIKTRNKIEIN